MAAGCSNDIGMFPDAQQPVGVGPLLQQQQQAAAAAGEAAAAAAMSADSSGAGGRRLVIPAPAFISLAAPGQLVQAAAGDQSSKAAAAQMTGYLGGSAGAAVASPAGFNPSTLVDQVSRHGCHEAAQTHVLYPWMCLACPTYTASA
jgi:hypothetical protein